MNRVVWTSNKDPIFKELVHYRKEYLEINRYIIGHDIICFLVGEYLQTEEL